MGKTPRKIISREQTRIARLESVAVLATRQLFDARIALARAHGYLDRVREREAAKDEQPAVMPDGIEKLRTVIGYSTDREASAVIEALSPELLARVLGKPEGGISEDSQIPSLFS